MVPAILLTGDLFQLLLHHRYPLEIANRPLTAELQADFSAREPTDVLIL